MKFLFLLFFSILLFQENFSQVPGSAIRYNGIDTFLINDPKTKFAKVITHIPSGDEKWDNKWYTKYAYKDAVIPFLVSNVRFRFLELNFEGDSTLSHFVLSNLYGCRLCKDSLGKGLVDFQEIKTCLEKKFGKKGKFKQLHLAKDFTHYAYEWRKRGIAIKLLIQYDISNPGKYGYAIDLVFATKYSPFW